MTRKEARTTLATSALAVAALALSACKSFSFQFESPDVKKVQSAYVIVAQRDKLPHGSEPEIKDLVRREKASTYPFFVQFLPQGETTWEMGDRHGLNLEPKIKRGRISLKFPRTFIEGQTDPSIALVVRFTDNSWKCEATPLVKKGEVEYVVGANDLVARP